MVRKQSTLLLLLALLLSWTFPASAQVRSAGLSGSLEIASLVTSNGFLDFESLRESEAPLACQAAFSVSYTGNTVNFSDQSTGNPNAPNFWFWDFGDGSTSAQQNPSHNYANSGLYNVCLTIQTPDSCISTTCQNVQANGSGGGCQAFFTSQVSGPLTANFADGSQAGPNANYFWDFGDGGSSNQQNPSHTYNQGGLYVVCLTIIDNVSACQDTYCDSVFVQGGGQVVCNAAFNVSYSGNTVNFSDQSTGSPNAPNAWFWDFGDGSTSTQQNPSHNYANSGLYNVCLTIQTPDSCISSTCQNVQANGSGGCQALFTYSQSSPGIFNFTDASQSNPGPSYSWSFGDGSGSTSQNPSHVYTQPGSYAVCLTIFDSLTNCQDTYCDSVLVVGGGTSCNAAFTYSQNGNATTFVDGSTAIPNAPNSWFWDFGDGTTSTQQNPTHIYPTGGQFTACLTIMTPDSCTSTTCQTVQIPFSGCQAFFTYSQSSPGIFNFTDASQTNPGPSYSWSFGDGSGSTSQNPSHVYTQPGSYLVCLTIFDSLTNCQDTYCDSILVQTGGNPSCNATFSWSYSGPSVVFVDQSTSSPNGITSWFWDFGDGTTSTAQNPLHTYNAGGLYTVCLTITTQDSCTSTNCQPVQASGGGFPQCNANFTWSYSGNTVAFTDQSSSSPSPISDWFWDFGDGTTSTQQNPSHNYAQGGLYTVCLNILTFDSCSSVVCYQLQANGNAGCQASFAVTPDTTGQAAFIITHTSLGNNLNFFWDFGDGNTSTQVYPTHQYGGPGTYLVCLTVWDSLTNCQDTHCDTITIAQGQSPVIVIQAPITSVQEAAVLDIGLYPNPVQDILGLRLGLESSEEVRIRLVDMHGRVVLERAPEFLSAGEHRIELDASQLADGLYLTQIQIGGQVFTEKAFVRK